jgi:hypothetical protein
MIPANRSTDLRGMTVTVGAWIWASSPIQARTPAIDDGRNVFFETIDVGLTSQFYTYTAVIDENVHQLYVRLQAPRQAVELDTSVFYDGIILVEGDHSLKGQPNFQDVNGTQVEWGDERLDNFIRNASFERAVPQFRPQIDDFLTAYLPSRLSLVISSLIDFEGYRAYYTGAAEHLFRSFWAVFGWGQVRLLGSKPYRILLIITIIGLIGDMVYLWRNRRELPFHSLGFLGLHSSECGVWR